MPNPENREATHVNLPKSFKEPGVNEYREALGTEEFRQAQIEDKAFRSDKALEQKIEAALEAAPAGSIEASALVRNESPSRSTSE